MEGEKTAVCLKQIHTFQEIFLDVTLGYWKQKRTNDPLLHTHSHTHTNTVCIIDRLLKCINYSSVLLVCPELNLKSDAVHFNHRSVSSLWPSWHKPYSSGQLFLSAFLSPYSDLSPSVRGDNRPSLSINLSVPVLFSSSRAHPSLTGRHHRLRVSTGPMRQRGFFYQPYSHQKDSHRGKMMKEVRCLMNIILCLVTLCLYNVFHMLAFLFLIHCLQVTQCTKPCYSVHLNACSCKYLHI